MKYALTVSVNAAATGRVSCAPIVKGLGPRDEPVINETQLATNNSGGKREVLHNIGAEVPAKLSVLFPL